MAQPTFFPSHCWVSKGCFELVPKRAELNANYAQLLKEEARKAKTDLRAAQAAAAAQAEAEAGANAASAASPEDADAARIHREYNMDDYDNEDQPPTNADPDGDAADSDDDMEANDAENPEVDDLDSDEDEDLKLEPTDNLIVVAQVQPSECISEAQIHVYSEPNKQFYEHRSFYLDSMPLCFDWVGRGHLLAVGCMDPQVQLWDLDLLDALVPLAKLEGHSDAVLDVAWNPRSPQALATASADKRIGLWDLDGRKCVRMLAGIHKDKAQALAWHPQEPHLLLTGGYDSVARLVDCRAPPSDAKTVPRWKLDGECERLAWDRRNPLFLLAATESGSVQRCDARKPGAPVSTLKAHTGACCGLCVTDSLLCTGGADGLVKLWRANQNGDWKLLASRDWSVGEVTKLTANPDCQCVLGVTGMSGFRVWDVREDTETRAYLASRGVAIPDA